MFITQQSLIGTHRADYPKHAFKTRRIIVPELIYLLKWSNRRHSVRRTFRPRLATPAPNRKRNAIKTITLYFINSHARAVRFNNI